MKELFARRSVRNFKPDPIEQNKIEILLKAAMCTPTCDNQNEWEFIVVTERSLLDRLSQTSPYTACIKDSPLAIVLLANTQKIVHADNWEQEMSAATEAILLECVHLDMSGVWLGISPMAERMANVSKLFGLPDTLKPFAITAIGYPLQKEDVDREFDFSIVHYNEY